MKLVETIEGGYQKTLIEGDSTELESYLAGIESAKNQNLVGDMSVLAVLKELSTLFGTDNVYVMEYRILGMLAAVQGIKGKVEVVA